MKALALNRIILSRRFLYTLSILSIIFSVLNIVGRFYLVDYLVYAFAPPTDLVAIPLYCFLILAIKKNKPQLIVAILPAILTLALISILYYIMICYLPAVITLISHEDFGAYIIQYFLYACFFVYFLVIYLLTCMGIKLKKVIKFNTYICIFFTVLVVFYIVTWIAGYSISGEVDFADSVAVFDFVLENLFSIFSQLKLVIAISISVSLQAFTYLYTQKLLDNYI